LAAVPDGSVGALDTCFQITIHTSKFLHITSGNLQHDLQEITFPLHSEYHNLVLVPTSQTRMTKHEEVLHEEGVPENSQSVGDGGIHEHSEWPEVACVCTHEDVYFFLLPSFL
jgi:hypothetical protein